MLHNNTAINANEMTNQHKESLDFITVILDNNLQAIKKYCGDPLDLGKFNEFMTLGKDDGNKKNTLKAVSALYIAAKNGHDQIVNFIIENSMQYDEGKKRLVNHLVRYDEEEKNVLHVSTFVPNNASVISTLCQAAKLLSQQGYVALTNYVNSKENMYGGTALHLAARRGQLANYLMLKDEGADPDIISQGEKKPIDLVKHGDLRDAIPFLAYLILNTNEGKKYFKNKHPQYVDHLYKISTNLLNEIINIDIDSDLEHGAGQLSAFNRCQNLLKTLAQSEPTEQHDIVRGIVLTYYGYINYALIRSNDFSNNDNNSNNNNNNNSEMTDTLYRLIEKSKVIQSDNKANDLQYKNAYIRAGILSTYNFSQSNNEALANDGFLVGGYPHLALAGMMDLIGKKGVNDDTLAYRITVAFAKMKLNYIQTHPKKKSILDRFRPTEDMKAIKQIEQFLEDLRDTQFKNNILALVRKTFSTEPMDSRLLALKKDIEDTFNLFPVTEQVLDHNNSYHDGIRYAQDDTSNVNRP